MSQPPSTPDPTAPDPTAPDPTVLGPTAPEPADPDPGHGHRSGELYARVALLLCAQPDRVLTPGEVTRDLGAPSSGAVFEALKRMAPAGHATHHSNPHRFQITAEGVAAAGALPPPTARPATARTTTGGGQSPRGRGPILRPNGERYFPRRLAGGTDIDVLRRFRDRRIQVLLYGPPGTGKTAMVEAAFPDLETLVGTEATAVEDFLGNYVPVDGGGYEWAYGPLTTAMREGRPLLIDDATLVNPKVLAVAYPAMDGRRVVHIPYHRNERVEAADGFYILAAHNPGVHGAILTEALSSRFEVHIHVSTDWDLARHLGVPPRLIDAAKALNTALAAGRIGWAPQLREALGFTRVAKTIGLPAAVANLAGRAPEPDREQVIAELNSHFGTSVTPLALGPQR